MPITYSTLLLTSISQSAGSSPSGSPSRAASRTPKSLAAGEGHAVERNKFVAVAVDGQVKDYGAMAKRKHSGTE